MSKAFATKVHHISSYCDISSVSSHSFPFGWFVWGHIERRLFVASFYWLCSFSCWFALSGFEGSSISARNWMSRACYFIIRAKECWCTLFYTASQGYKRATEDVKKTVVVTTLSVWLGWLWEGYAWVFLGEMYLEGDLRVLLRSTILRPKSIAT